MRSSAVVAPRSRAFSFDTSIGPIDSRLDRAHGIMPVPDNALVPLRQLEIGMPGHKGGKLRIDRPLNQTFRPTEFSVRRSSISSG
jgi:hypothetical protein